MAEKTLSLLTLCTFFFCVAFTQTNIPVTDPNWYWTEYNWGFGDGYAQAVNPGAYFKVGFTGTSVSVQLNFKGASTSNYSTIKYIIDGAPEKDVTLPLPAGGTVLQLATGLASTNHTLFFFIKNSLQGLDRWAVPVCVTRVTGLILDSGASTTPVTLRPKRMLVYWDSIGEGVGVLDFPGNDLTHNDATETWAFSLAAALQAEVSMAAFGRLGWTVWGNGGVPPVFTPGNDTISSWDKIDSTHIRNFTGRQLDYVVIGHGTNDGLTGATDANVQASAYGWLVAMRAAISPSTPIIVVIPFGGFERSVLSEVFSAYQAKYNDKYAYYLDLGTPAEEGLTHFNGGDWQSADGIHPNVWRDGQLGAMLALGIGSLLGL